MSKEFWDSQTLAFWHYWKRLFRTYTTTFVLLTQIEREAPQLQKDSGPRSFQIWIWGPQR